MARMCPQCLCGRAANVLHVKEHFHVIIIHLSLLSCRRPLREASLEESRAVCGAFCQLSPSVLCLLQCFLVSLASCQMYEPGMAKAGLLL